ncbi:hypothetical protein PMAYCL1PPCAC_00907, partial [Pristionchus mayeri]
LLLLLCLASPTLASSNCGVRHSASATSTQLRRILGGNEVTVVGKWPWQILLIIGKFRNDGTPYSDMCGGTIISNRWILTAAHCLVYVRNGEQVTAEQAVVYGEVTNSSADPRAKSRANSHAFKMLEAYPHANYTDAGYKDDVALIKLDETITFDGAVSPICLPNGAQDVPADGHAVTTGFGDANIRGSDELLDDGKLRETVVPIVREDICEYRWTNNKKLSHPISVEQWRQRGHLLCAGSFGHDAGGGDSGGPLMMKSSDGRWFQIGITAFGEKSMESDMLPGAYTDVREYCEWIAETTNGKVKCQGEEVNLRDVDIQM